MLGVQTLHMRVDYCRYEGREVVGAPEVVLQRGNVLVERGEFFAKPGDGRFLERRPFSTPTLTRHREPV